MNLRLICTAIALLAVPAGAEPLRVQAATGVAAWYTQRLAGDAVEVSVILPADADPATWQPGIAAISEIQQGGLIVLNGAGFEPWAARVSLPRARTVDLSAALEPEFISIQGTAHSHGGSDHTHQGVASQLWLDFRLAGLQAAALALGLSRALPDQAGEIAANLALLQADLDRLAGQAAVASLAYGGQTVLTWQPGFEYFARANGLTLREVTMDAGADSPTPGQLAALDAAVLETGARVMLWGTAPPVATRDALAAQGVTAILLPSGIDQPPGIDLIVLWRQGLEALGAAVQE